MGWTAIADELWRLQCPVVVLLAALYLVPISSILTLSLEEGRRGFMRINRIFGAWEHAVGGFRDSFVALYLAGGAAWHIYLGLGSSGPEHFVISAAALALAASGWVNRRLRHKAHLKLITFVRHFPTIHPQEFFDHLLCSSGFIRHKLPGAPFSLIDSAAIDFRSRCGRKMVGPFSLVAGAWSTIWAAKLVMMSSRLEDRAAMLEAASALAVIWGSRICQLARAALTVEGRENLPESGTQAIYLFTHMSFIDFALVPLLLAARPPRQDGCATQNNLPKFLMAKDHFRDNPIYYRLLGLGRAAEAMGMIFVDRKALDRTAEARRIAGEASEGLFRGEGDLAIFPQGGRAAPFSTSRGERMDAGYYTVGGRGRIRADGAHLKKGAAHIAAVAAMKFRAAGRKDDALLIPVAVSGTAIACPRGRMRIQPCARFKLSVGEPITTLLPPDVDDNYMTAVAHIHSRIDGSLKAASHIHAELERRLFEDVRGMLDPMQIDEISLAMKTWRGDDYLLHAILDAIYACHPNLWRPFLGELTHLILNFATREEMLALKGRVAEKAVK
ncbi:MAG: lysophospholipid acyltransferase family protein [Pseudomonadota bacterium]